MEGRIPEATRKELEARVHKVKVAGDWSGSLVMAVQTERKTGVISGAASPRGQLAYVMGS